MKLFINGSQRKSKAARLGCPIAPLGGHAGATLSFGRRTSAACAPIGYSPLPIGAASQEDVEERPT